MEKIIQRICFICSLVLSMQPVMAADISVTVKSFNQLAIYPVVQVPASVVSLNNSKISAEVNAVIKEIVVDVGQTVNRGAVLLRLDSSYYQLEYNRSKAVLQSINAKRELANYQLQRAKSLANKKLISDELIVKRESDLNVLTSEVAAQQALRDIAKRNLKRCTIRAPFKAVVKERLGHVGELARVGTPLIHIVDVEKLEISAKIQSNDIVSLKSAKKVELVSQGGRFEIKLKNITAAYDSIERSQEVRFSFVRNVQNKAAQNKESVKSRNTLNKSNADLPGAFGKITWRKAAPHIPAELMVRRGGNLGIFVLKKNTSRFVSLINAKEGQPVASPKLSKTVSIIVDGRYRLQDGSRVKIKKQ